MCIAPPAACRHGCAAQHMVSLEASEGRLREQMQALQRKLLRVVTENEALRHVADKLQYAVLALRRQLQAAGLAPAVELDDALLRPAPHQVGARPAGNGSGCSGSGCSRATAGTLASSSRMHATKQSLAAQPARLRRRRSPSPTAHAHPLARRTSTLPW